MLDAKADPGSAPLSGRHLVRIAEHEGHDDVAVLLVRAKASVGRSSEHNQTAAVVAAAAREDEDDGPSTTKRYRAEE